MQIQRSVARALPQLCAFYQQCGYKGTIVGDSDVFYVTEQQNLIAALRLSPEQGVWVLRGMQVAKPYRGQHLGRHILQVVADYLSQQQRACYCLPFSHLTHFYAEAGFLPLAEDAAPPFLRERWQGYLAEGLNISLMKRPVSPLQN